MNLYLLDAGGAGLAYLFIGVFIVFMILCVLIEAGIMLAMKYNRVFKKTFRDSLLVNLASVAFGFILIRYVSSFFGSYEPVNMLVLYAISVAVEFGVLYLLNKTHPPGKTFLVSAVMNIPSYILLYLNGNN